MERQNTLRDQVNLEKHCTFMDESKHLNKLNEIDMRSACPSGEGSGEMLREI